MALTSKVTTRVVLNRQAFSEILAPDADDLPRRAGRIAQRAKQIERRVNPQLPANPRDSRRRAVIKRREHETDPDLVQRRLRHRRYRRNVHAQRRQQIRAARFTARSAIAMFSDRQSSAGDDKRCRRRDVESLRRARPRSRSVDETLMLRIHAHRTRTQPFNQPGQLLNCFAFRSQRDERGRDLRVGRFRIE